MGKIAKKSEGVLRPNALEVFTNREGFISAFDDLITGKNPTDNDVLVFYGEGGIGKTTLSMKLQQRLDEVHPGRLCARLDFKDPHNIEPDYALFRLKEKFPSIAFPTFSIALVEYARRVHPEVAFLSNRDSFLSGSGPFTDLIEVAFDTPGVSIPLKGIRAVAEGSRLLKDWYRKRAEPLLRGISSYTEEELLELLPVLWAKDFRDGLFRLSDPDGFFDAGKELTMLCPVVFLDTYEMLWRRSLVSEGTLSRMREGWLVTLVGELPEILWVITGRDRLGWECYDSAWEDCCKQHFTGGLSDSDGALFLGKRGITEQEIVAAVVKAAGGVPFYLELEAQLYDKGVRKAELFGGTRSDVIERFLGYLDKEERASMYVMSAFRLWDEALFRDAVTHFKTGFPANECSTFGRSWSVEQPSKGFWAIHQEMRRHLQAALAADRPNYHTEIHQWGFNRFDALLEGISSKNATPDSAEALGLASAHAREIMQPEQHSEWFWSRYHQMVDGRIWRPLVLVLEGYLAYAEDAYGPAHPEVVAVLNHLARLLEILARYNEAEPLYRKILAISEVVYKPDHPDVAAALNNLTQFLASISRYDEAVPLCLRSLEISQAAYGPDHPNVAAVLNNLARLLGGLACYDEAEPLYRESLAISEAAYGLDHPSVALALNNLGKLLVTLSRYDEAEPLFRRSLAIREAAYGPDHPDVAVILNNLATLIYSLSRYDEAEPLLRRSLAIGEAAYGFDHPMVATALDNLAVLIYSLSRVDEAEPLFRRSLAIREAAYGPDHPNVAVTLNNLARLLKDLARYDEAEALFRRSLAIREAAYGPDHPDVAVTLNNLATLLETLERYDEANALRARALQNQL